MTFLKPGFAVVLMLSLIGCASSDFSSDKQPLPTNSKEDKQQNYIATMEHVNALIKDKKYREAELILTREAQKNLNDFVVQSKLLYINSAQAKDSIRKADLEAAGSDVDAGDIALITLKHIILTPDSSVPKDFPVILKGQEDELLTIKKNLTDSIDGYCNKKLTEADAFAKKAKNLVTRNDRNMIIAGLKKVRECNQYGKWASIETKSKSTNSVRMLLDLAEEKEHDSLLRSAGFGFQ